MLLDPGFDLTLRPMKYPVFFDMYKDAIKNTWTVEEVDFSTDVVDLQKRLNDSERHLVNRLVAFFATGDSIVSNNLVLSLYKHINAPEARMYLSRQLYEEALHVQFYLTLLDTYIPDLKEREAAFAASKSCSVTSCTISFLLCTSPFGSATYSSASKSNSEAYASLRPTRLTLPLFASM